MSIIQTHKQLADCIQGKKILLLNSLGKDSIVCLEWLYSYAKPEKIYSMTFEFLAEHPDDKRYLNYLKKRYPKVEFFGMPDPSELTEIITGIYQSPIMVNHEFNKYEYQGFERIDLAKEIQKKLGCDYLCRGASAYEGFWRMLKFRRKGLIQDGIIYPIGNFKKQQVIDVIVKGKIKLHPSYAYSEGTLDAPSYYKMRNTFLANKEYKKTMYKIYPLLELDEYRFEVLKNGKK